MTKKRKHRQNKRRHHEATQATKRRQREAAMREISQHLVEAFHQVEDAAGDQRVVPEEFADRVLAIAGDEVCSSMLADQTFSYEIANVIAERAGPERGRALASALAVRLGDRPVLTWLAVSIADLVSESDASQLEQILEIAFEHLDGDDADDAACMLARVRFDAGSPFEALSIIEPVCSRAPEHADAQAVRARFLARAALLDALSGGEVDKSVSRLASVLEIAEPSAADLDAARAALRRFADRSMLHELQSSVDAFIEADPELTRWHAEYIAEFLDEARRVGGLGPLDELGGNGELLVGALVDRGGAADPQVGPSALAALAAERAWLSGPEQVDGDDLTDDESVLGCFAASPTTPERLARAASSWLRNVRYGLWQLDLPGPHETDPIASGGSLVVDLVTRRRMFAAIPTEQLAGMPRWSVLAGAIGPVDGVWRSGTTMLVLDPRQADTITELLLAMAEAVIVAAAREHGVRVPHARPRPPKQPRPHGVLVDTEEEMEPPEADITSKAVGAALAYVVGMVEVDKRRVPQLSNIDGDPIELVSARFPVNDPLSVRKRLVTLENFESADDDLDDVDGRDDEGESNEVAAPVRWLGRQMTDTETANSLKQLEVEAKGRGWGRVLPDPGPRHWVRGFIHFRREEITVDVNSRRRLEEITDVLVRAGAGKPVIGPMVDPALDLAIPGGRLSTGNAQDPELEAAWRESWVDERVPALGGVTPREAAEDPGRRLLLESLLRQFEHDADLALAKGTRSLDVDALRELLGMSDGI
jgi:hypothetical protein